MRDQRGIPRRMQVAGRGPGRVGAAFRPAEDRHEHAVAAGFEAQRVIGLVQVADEVDEKLQRNR